MKLKLRSQRFRKNHLWKTVVLHSKTLCCTALTLASFQPVFTHGTVTSPPSRVWVCFQENPESPDSPACDAAVKGWGTQAFYDWTEVARMDAGGEHRKIINDGNLASAGRPDKFGGLDQVRDDWVATPVTPGPFTLTWTITAPHETLYYEVYITKEGWTPNQPLTWDSIELLKRTGGRPLSSEDKIDVVLPERTGKHVLYSIWQRSKTPEAFYSTSDIDFGNNTLDVDSFEKSKLGAVEQNYPNPFTSKSTIKYSLQKKSPVNITVYNILGQKVKTLINTEKGAGEHEIVFNADDKNEAGVYFYVFRTGDYSETRRMVIRK
ncbi:lytic polysaccharide monooxygenase [Aquimarina sp. ERC-38]|uniref:lytic polysaccharide monooxygenase n=1 Tax=Aquimarina sp. ERC-38 TaxID=2949996 RepID=UPI0022452946|nr:lytic polysaccharide monooxygenase [Aquimarina sp. ERC-38]UZO80160.1 lytic polysaccharide monooxygenase [Aquimarina sp. ERC-38]